MAGVPGTGKTMLAKAVAHHTTAAFIRVVGSEFVQKYLGEVCSPRLLVVLQCCLACASALRHATLCHTKRLLASVNSLLATARVRIPSLHPEFAS